MIIEVRKKDRRPVSLEEFLHEHGIKIYIEYSETHKEEPYLVIPEPHISVETDPPGGHTGPNGSGRYADLAMRAFLNSISGKRITPDAGRTYIQAPCLEWDGILRVPIKRKKKQR